MLDGGGNTWRYSYSRVQDYQYGAKEVHSYPLEVWMSFGILGIISFLAIMIITIINIVKMAKNKKIDSILLSIIIGTLLILFHSFVDFNMSFLIILLMTYMLIAIINKEDKQLKINLRFIDFIVIITFAIATIFSAKDLIANSYDNNTDKLKMAPYNTEYMYNKIDKMYSKKIKSYELSNSIMKRIKEYNNLEPNFRQAYMQRVYCIELNNVVNTQNVNEQLENIDYIVSEWKYKPNTLKFDIDYIIQKSSMINKLGETLTNIYMENNDDRLKQYIIEIYELAMKEYPDNCEIIKGYKKYDTDETKSIENLQYYTKIYDEIINKYTFILKSGG